MLAGGAQWIVRGYLVIEVLKSNSVSKYLYMVPNNPKNEEMAKEINFFRFYGFFQASYATFCYENDTESVKTPCETIGF